MTKQDFQIPTDNQPDIVVVDTTEKGSSFATSAVIDVAIPSDTNIKKREHKKVEKYQGLNEKAIKNVDSEGHSSTSGIGALCAITPTERVASADSRNICNLCLWFVSIGIYTLGGG